LAKIVGVLASIHQVSKYEICYTWVCLLIEVSMQRSMSLSWVEKHF